MRTFDVTPFPKVPPRILPTLVESKPAAQGLTLPELIVQKRRTMKNVNQ